VSRGSNHGGCADSQVTNPSRPARLLVGRGAARWGTIGLMHRIAKVATKRRLGDVDTSWVEYWRTRSVDERLAMATELSLECVGDYPDQGLRRVHRVLRRS
jgi:hypothetical protein